MRIVFSVLFMIFFNNVSNAQDSVPKINREVLNFVVKNGRIISPTYKSAVCTELVIDVLCNFIDLKPEDKSRIRIITSLDVFQLIKDSSEIPKGVYFALIKNGSGSPVEIDDVKPGDFVQFWYETWGHCGIVESIDLKRKTMNLHSSFPSTDGYGIQEFEIPSYCFFVRLN